MQNQFSRTELLLGGDAMETLRGARVAIFGIGGVGSYTAEALVRGGVGALDLVDNDTVALSNLNRQLFATRKTVGKYKPDVVITAHKVFYTPKTAGEFDFTAYDYVVDAIDTVTGKIALVMQANAAKTPIISAMGAGNKLDPTAFAVTDIYKTSVCPLAKVMRNELRKRKIRRLKVVYSKELPTMPTPPAGETGEAPVAARRLVPGSTSFVPPVVGLIIAGEVIKDLTGVRGKGRGV